MEKRKKLKDFKITLDELYKGQKQINIHISGKPYIFHVVLIDRKGFDCKISSFGANLWARTTKGMDSLKYKYIGMLERELKKLINQKVDASGEILFSLSDEVYTF